MSRWGMYLLCTLVVCCSADWSRGDGVNFTYHGSVAEGGQIDALPGTGDTIHLLSSKYYQFNSNGTKLLEEEYGDPHQASFDFPPAISVGPENGVHAVTRRDGTYDEGFDIQYRKRSNDGSWSTAYNFGSREKRNYVVGIATDASDNTLMLYTRAGVDVEGNVLLWREQGGSAAKIGEMENIWRADADARMRGQDGRVFFTSGKPDFNGAAYYSWCNAESDCLAELKANMQDHRAGLGRRGFTDLYIDGQGDVHITYGTQYSVYYNRYNNGEKKAFANDIQIFSDLGDGPFLGIGVSAVAASDGGELVASVAMENETGELLFALSTDTGKQWSVPHRLGVFTEAGEGRRRPRLVAKGNVFSIFYHDLSTRSIHLIRFDGDAILSAIKEVKTLIPQYLLLLN